MKTLVHIAEQSHILDITGDPARHRVSLGNLNHRAVEIPHWKPGTELVDQLGDICVFIGPTPDEKRAVISYTDGVYVDLPWNKLEPYSEIKKREDGAA